MAEKTWSARDIAAVLNNAFLRALKPHKAPVEETRLRRLTEYTQALVEPVNEHTNLGILTKEEAVAVLSGAALYFQMRYVLGTDKIPTMRQAEAVMEGE